MNLGLFRAASLQTQRAPFGCTELSSDLCRVCDGCSRGCARGMPAQTTSVLRRILAMSAAHAGWPGPGFPSALRPVTWWTATVVPVSQSSHIRLRSRLDQLLAGIGNPGGRGVADDRLPVLPQGDPAETRYQVRLALPVPPGLEAGSQPVTGLDLGPVAGRHLGDGGAVLGGQGLQQRGQGVPPQAGELRYVLGKQGRVGCPARSGIRRYRPFPDSLPPNSACPLSRH